MLINDNSKAIQLFASNSEKIHDENTKFAISFSFLPIFPKCTNS